MKAKFDICFYDSPIGKMLLGAGKSGISFCRFFDDDEKVVLSSDSYVYFENRENKYLKMLIEEFYVYFAGELKEFKSTLDIEGTNFQISVWKALLTIQYGETITYMSQATQLGNEKAIRAIASANGKNKHAIIIPCHRVIGKNGKLTGYAGGLWRKQYLLELERENSGKPTQRVLF